MKIILECANLIKKRLFVLKENERQKREVADLLSVNGPTNNNQPNIYRIAQ